MPTHAAASAAFLAVPVAAIVIPALPAVAGQGDARRHTRTEVFVLKAGEVTSLNVKSASGHIVITPHEHKNARTLPEWFRPAPDDLPSFDPATDVVVVARIHAHQRDWLSDATLEPRLTGGVLTLRAEWADTDRKQDAYGVDYVIRMPRVTPVEASSGMGDVRIADAHGAVTARAGMGDVTVESPRGPVSVTCGMGDVDVTFADTRPGRAVVKTGMGNVTVRGFTGGELTTSQGDVTGVLAASPAEDLKLSTAMGSVRLTLPDQLDATVESVTAMGKVSFSGSPDKAEKSGHGSYTTHTAVFGTGEPVIRCTTNMGNVSID